LGCEITDHSTGRRIGAVTGWQEYGGPPLLEVENERGQEILIPFAKSICVKIDPAARRIEVDLPEGLVDLNDPGQGAP
jgi:16S rRNA processing protein RimM